MIDEWLEARIDRLCDWAPRYFGPRWTRYSASHFGWRMRLYGSAIRRRFWGALTSIKWIEEEQPQEEMLLDIPQAANPELDKLDAKTRKEIEDWNADLKTWSEKQEKERGKWQTPKERMKQWWAGRHEREKKSEERWAKREEAADRRAQKHMARLWPLMLAIENSRFAVMLLYTMLSAFGAAAAQSGSMAYMAAACCAMWLAEAMEAGYAPIAGRVRQRYLAALGWRFASFLMLVPMYFEAYMQGGVKTNVVLQSAMIILLFTHVALSLALVVFNGRQPLFLRMLSCVLGVIPALMAAAAIALCVARVAMPPVYAAFSMVGALGALMAFAADRARTLHDLGGIRLRYTPVWTSFMMELGFFLMILGSWIAG